MFYLATRPDGSVQLRPHLYHARLLASGILGLLDHQPRSHLPAPSIVDEPLLGQNRFRIQCSPTRRARPAQGYAPSLPLRGSNRLLRFYSSPESFSSLPSYTHYLGTRRYVG